MIEDIKPYAEYKDSGLPWLGKIPKHWDVKRFKYLLREINMRSLDGNEQLWLAETNFDATYTPPQEIPGRVEK